MSEAKSSYVKNRTIETKIEVDRNGFEKITPEFWSLFAGKEKLGSRGESALNALSFLQKNSVKARKIINACIVFANKPSSFLTTGKTRSGKGDGRTVSVNLIKYLPQLTADEIAHMTESSRVKMSEKRSRGPEEFANINMGQVRTICFLAAEMVGESNRDEMLKAWFKVHLVKPSEQIVQYDTALFEEMKLKKGEASSPYLTEAITKENFARFQKTLANLDIKDVVKIRTFFSKVYEPETRSDSVAASTSADDTAG
jgi:hypothetical protein